MLLNAWICSLENVIVFTVTTCTGTCTADAPEKLILQKPSVAVDMVKCFWQKSPVSVQR